MNTTKLIIIPFMVLPDYSSHHVNSILQYALLDKSRYQSFHNLV